MIESEFDILDYDAGVSDEILGAECASCFRCLRWKFFPRNSTYKSGYGPQCLWCLRQPRLGMAEHAARLREMNYNSEGTRRQRHADQEEFHKHANTSGESMDCSLFLQKLHHIYPSLYITQGMVTINGIVDVSLFATSGTARSEWKGNTFKYMGWVSLGMMPEYTQYEFSDRDVLLRPLKMGWRSTLLRFIKEKILTEGQVYAEFGKPSGFADSTLWYKKLHQYRNEKNLVNKPSFAA